MISGPFPSLPNFRAPNRSGILPLAIGDFDMVARLHLFVLPPIRVDIDFASTGNQLHPNKPLLVSPRARILARAANLLVHQIPIYDDLTWLELARGLVFVLGRGLGAGVGEVIGLPGAEEGVSRISAAAMCSFSSTTASPLFLEQPARVRRITPDTMIRAGRKESRGRVIAFVLHFVVEYREPPLARERMGATASEKAEGEGRAMG